MEELLLRIEQEDGLGKLEDYSTDKVAQALARFTEALRKALLLLEQETKDGEEENSSVNAKWLQTSTVGTWTIEVGTCHLGCQSPGR
jgi:hypothetical protein